MTMSNDAPRGSAMDIHRLALVGGFVTMMIMIARMLFTPPAA
jgi:hypothetical protein